MRYHKLYRILLLLCVTVEVNIVLAQSAFNTSFNNDSTLDAAFSVVQTLDGGYILGGNSFNPFIGFSPIFIVRTDCHGDTLWTKSIKISSTGGDVLSSILELGDGSFILGGDTQDTTLFTTDIYIMKLNSSGDQQWIKFYGGTSNDHTFGGLAQTDDKGFTIAGYSSSFGSGDNDFYLLHTDSLGNQQWQNNYGGAGEEICISMDATDDGGYILSGRTNSFGQGQFDLYLVKVDSAGGFEWQQTYGTLGSEGGGGAVQTMDGGYVFSGNVEVTGTNTDGYVVKTDSLGNLIWDNSYGGPDYDGLDQIRQLSDGTYIAVGTSEFDVTTEQEGWLLKIQADGNSSWSKLFGNDSVGDYFYDVQLTADRGFVLCGQFNHIGWPFQDFWLIKTDSLGCDSLSCSLNCTTCDFIGPSFTSSVDTVFLIDSTIVQFTDNSLIANEWVWDFGDGGASSSLQNPIYTYDSLGTYIVTMVASFGTCSDTADYTIVVLDAVGIDMVDQSGHSLANYPNPFQDEIIFTAWVPQSGTGVIIISGIHGRVLEQITLQAGENNMHISGQNFIPGIYICSLYINEQMIETKRIVRLK